MAMETQTTRILAHLKSGKTITPAEAQEKYGCYRLGARIYDLKQEGHQIHTDRVDSGQGTKFAQYSLVRKPARTTKEDHCDAIPSP